MCNTLIYGNYPKVQATQKGFVGEKVAAISYVTYISSIYAIVRFLLHQYTLTSAPLVLLKGTKNHILVGEARCSDPS